MESRFLYPETRIALPAIGLTCDMESDQPRFVYVRRIVNYCRLFPVSHRLDRK